MQIDSISETDEADENFLSKVNLLSVELELLVF